jgi:hypothetical protein
MTETAEVAPGIPEMKISELPTVKKPEVWEFSAHPHATIRAKGREHIDMRLGNPSTGIAHSFVLPKSKVPKPGEMVQVIPTVDHTVPYMDFAGDLPPGYGHGTVTKGRRTKAEVYHADPGDEAGTKLRFNLYDEASPEEFSVRKDGQGRFFLHNKTQTRERRPDLPASKPSYKEIQVDDLDLSNPNQVLMPKLDGAHVILDLKAGRSPRVFSYRVAKRAPTGLLEHTHKMPGLLEKKVPKSLDGTTLRAEALAVDRDGKAIPAQLIGGLLNSGVWKSRSAQEELGVRLKVFPFSVVRHNGLDMESAPFDEKLKVLREAERSLKDVVVPEIAEGTSSKNALVSSIEHGNHPLTEEGVVAVDKDQPRYTKAKFAPDFDVYVRKIHPAVSGKTGEHHDRAGAVSYSWTPDGPIVGRLGGFKHDEAKDMLRNPDKYIGRAAKVKAMKAFSNEDGTPKTLFQPRFKEWHLDKGDIEKEATLRSFLDELAALQKEAAKRNAAEEKEAKELAGLAIAASAMVSPLGVGAVQSVLSRSMRNSPKVKDIADLDDIASKMGINAPARATAKKAAYMSPRQFREGPYLQEAISNGVSKKEIDRALNYGVVVAPEYVSHGTLPHEVGHAANRVKNKVLRALSVTVRNSKSLMPLSAIAGGIMTSAPEDAESLAVTMAPALPLLAYAPVLAEEALASVRGIKGMRDLGTYSPKVISQAKGNLVKAFGTYLMSAAAYAAPIAVLSAGRKWMGKKEKTASPLSYRRVLPSLFARAYKEDEDFRNVVRKTLSTDPNTRRQWG